MKGNSKGLTSIVAIIASWPEDWRADLLELLLVPSDAQKRKFERDALIRNLAKFYHAKFGFGAVSVTAERIVFEWRKYLTLHWKAQKNLTLLPPETAPPLPWLHRISRLNNGQSLGVRQVTSIIEK